jgi:sarcosine oxidase subunit alpha
VRIAGKGLINREKTLNFKFDGLSYKGFEGDTVASALLASGKKIFGRSFKYHRPRGVLTAGSEEPNALITVGQGAFQDPNVRATTQEIFEGLITKSQNNWPNLQYDILSINDLFSNFLGAGFYYKTFMWPKSFWEKIYEPFIRRAAGLGALSGLHNSDTYEKAYAFCDLLIIGGGPSGLMAAKIAAKAGLDVILAEQEPIFGGRLNSETEKVDGIPGSDWAAKIIEELKALDNVRLFLRTTVTGVYDQGTFAAVERVGHHLPDRGSDRPLECFWRIVAKNSILAAGAIERGIAFPNNDRPGIMAASAVRTYLNRFGVSPGRSIALFCNNNTAHNTAKDLLESGINIAAIIDSREDSKTDLDVPFYHGAEVSNTFGRQGLNSIIVKKNNTESKIEVDCLAVSGGWNPTLHLTCHMNGRPTWDEKILSFVPENGVIPNMAVVGAANGFMDTHSCFASAQKEIGLIIKAFGKTAKTKRLPKAEITKYEISPKWCVDGKGRAWLDYQNDVTVKDIQQSVKENFKSVEHMKRYTTQGMAIDQGKNSNVAALAVLADATGRGIPETGTTTFRPPFVPVSIASMGKNAQGIGFAPQRYTTSHVASVDRGAPMVESGLWYRPSYFPEVGETNWRQSCDREIEMVRTNVGVCDVSTLGKIDIQGPDAHRLLDFVYTNIFSTLKVGKVRYGLMLREDGHVMDDGTTARLAENHYVMTTTTAAAGQVMRHLDFVHQCLHPEWDLSFISVTEQWAQFSIAGPKSQELINAVLDKPISSETFPFMSCASVGILGETGRLFRISFSGEHGYEIAVPARFGESLFRLLVSRAEEIGGGPYGMEALNVLRIEKGFITHAEIHGRITAFDLGMQRMVSEKKDCIGKTSASRPGLLDSEREQLIALKPVGSVKQIVAGAHLFDPNDDPIRENDRGYITSVGFSPTFGHFIGLGFFKGGQARLGEQIKMVDHLRGIETECEIINTVSFDPKGDRLRD